MLGGGAAGSDTVIEAIREAEKNDDVVAIVLRIDSPGGSALASASGMGRGSGWSLAVARLRGIRRGADGLGGVVADNGVPEPDVRTGDVAAGPCVFRRCRASVPTQARPSFRSMPGRCGSGLWTVVESGSSVNAPWPVRASRASA